MPVPHIESAAPVSAPRTLAAGVIGAVAAPSAAFLLAGTFVASRLYARPAAWFAVFAWGLAVHIAALAFLFGTLGLPEQVVRAVAAWKELAVVLLFAAVTIRAIAARGPRTAIHAADMPVLLLVALSFAMLAAADVWFVEQPRPLGMRLYGLRESCFFTLLYAVGRATPELGDDERVLRLLVRLGVILSVVALLESAFLSAELLALLGVAAYFQDFLGVEAISAGGLYGLPYYYFTGIGGQTVQRSGALFLSSQGLATSYLLFLPAATILMFAKRQRTTLKQWGTFLLMWAGLLSSVTRMTTLTCIAVVALLLVLFRRFDVLALFTGISMAALGAMMVALAPFAEFVWETLTWQTLSSQSHVADWTRGFYAIASHPLGAGLGTADVTPTRFSFETLASDNLLLKYGVELGIPGMLTFASLLIGIALTAYSLSRRSQNHAHRSLALLVLAITGGLAINGITAVMLTFPFLTYLYFWLAGTVVTHHERMTRSA